MLSSLQEIKSAKELQSKRSTCLLLHEVLFLSTEITLENNTCPYLTADFVLLADVFWEGWYHHYTFLSC